MLCAKARRLLLLRGCCLLGATISFFAAIREMPLADAVAITFIEPVILLIFSALILRERVRASRVCAALVGFGAVMLIVKPGAASFRPAGLIALLAAGFFSLYLLFTRQLQIVQDPPSPLLLLAYQCVPGSVLLCAALPFVWSPFESPVHLLLGASMGLIGAMSHGCLILAFSLSEASFLAPLLYAELIMQGVLGFVIWGDVPDIFALAGMLIIIAVGVFLGLTESKSAQAHVNGDAKTGTRTSELADASAIPDMTRPRATRSTAGLAAVFIGSCLFAAQNLCVKEALSLGASALEMTTARGVVMILCGLPFAIWRWRQNTRFPYEVHGPASSRWLGKWLVARVLFGWISMAWQHMALEHVPLGDAAAIVWTAPLWTAILGWIFLREAMGTMEMLAACSVVLGVVIISRPDFVRAALSAAQVGPPDTIGMVLCVGSSLTAACAIVSIRRLAQVVHWTVPLISHGLGQACLSPLLAAALGDVRFALPTRGVLGYMAACGLFAFVGQVCVTRGMEAARAGPASALLTSEVLMSFVFQAAAGRDAVHITSAVGATLIILSVSAMVVAQKQGRPAAPSEDSTALRCRGETCADPTADWVPGSYGGPIAEMPCPAVSLEVCTNPYNGPPVDGTRK